MGKGKLFRKVLCGVIMLTALAASLTVDIPKADASDVGISILKPNPNYPYIPKAKPCGVCTCEGTLKPNRANPLWSKY
jgi:hypothetical protein